jgi:hypothetical protein
LADSQAQLFILGGCHGSISRISDSIEAKKMQEPQLKDRKVQRHTLVPDGADRHAQARIGCGIGKLAMAQERKNRRQIPFHVRKFGAHVLRDIGVKLVKFDMFQALN